MIRKVICVVAFILAAGVSETAFAKRISEADAYNKALRFNGNSAISRSATMNLVKKDANYYIFNYGDGGFVIVSGSDLTDEILGYSKTGKFNEKSMPDNMKSFLQSYSDEIEYAEKNNINGKSVKSRSSETKPNIEPLIKSTWNQGYPYNAYCPEINGQKTLTGCVATTMAQIVAFHKSQYKPTGLHTYNNRSINLDTCSVNYENLCIDYTGNETNEQIHEIAKLMKTCGYVLDNSYGVNATSAYTADIMLTLIKYFDYNENDANWIVRYKYNSQDEWDNEIYNSLKNLNPVPYQASTGSTSHCFLCDGYEDGYFHINWGWGGLSDGYFKLNALNAGGYNFTYDGFDVVKSKGHVAIVNLHPNVLNTNKNSDSINPNTSYSVNETTLSIEYMNNSLYSGCFKYGYLAVNEQNDTTALSTNQVMAESGKQGIISISISELNFEPGVTKLIPVVYQNDKTKRISESDIYVAVTPYKSIFTENKDEIQPFFDKIYAENFKVTKLDNLKIKIEAINNSHPVLIFDFTGQPIYKGNDNEVKLPKPGFYTIKNGNVNTTFVIK